GGRRRWEFPPDVLLYVGRAKGLVPTPGLILPKQPGLQPCKRASNVTVQWWAKTGRGLVCHALCVARKNPLRILPLFICHAPSPVWRLGLPLLNADIARYNQPSRRCTFVRTSKVSCSPHQRRLHMEEPCSSRRVKATYVFKH